MLKLLITLSLLITENLYADDIDQRILIDGEVLYTEE